MNLDELLLTQEEGEKAVSEWALKHGRILQLISGHWEDVVLVVAKAQIEKIKNSGVTLATIRHERPKAPAIK